MIALDTVSEIKADELFAARGVIIDAVTRGSVITQDAGIRALSRVAAARQDYRKVLFPFLHRFLQTCRPKDLPRHAESMLPDVDSQHAAPFLALLSQRQSDLTDRQAARLPKVMAKAQRLVSEA